MWTHTHTHSTREGREGTDRDRERERGRKRELPRVVKERVRQTVSERGGDEREMRERERSSESERYLQAMGLCPVEQHTLCHLSLSMLHLWNNRNNNYFTVRG